jgi:hypothetical protein
MRRILLVAIYWPEARRRPSGNFGSDLKGEDGHPVVAVSPGSQCVDEPPSIFRLRRLRPTFSSFVSYGFPINDLQVPTEGVLDEAFVFVSAHAPALNIYGLHARDGCAFI